MAMTVVAGTTPGDRTLDELAGEIRSGVVRIAAATAAWLESVAEFDEREGWGGVGIHSCAHWLAWQCGMSPGAAREHVRVARSLAGLPVTAEAFASGRLSYSKVREITRVADAATEVELWKDPVLLTPRKLGVSLGTGPSAPVGCGGRRAGGGQAVLPVACRRRRDAGAAGADGR